MRSFTFNGTKSAVYGLVVSGSGTFDAPKRDVTAVEVPGRNGSLTIDKGRYKNITVTYPGILVARSGVTFADQVRSINVWLCSAAGYKRLTDDYHPAFFRMARFINGIEWEVSAINTAGRCNIQFDCMPQRFLVSGELTTTLNAAGTLTNPTLFESKPRIRIIGTGNCTLNVNGASIVIRDITSGITLDSEICRAYNGNTPKDSTMTGDFPVLVPGVNTISWTGSGVESVRITPRWWTL